MTNEELFDEYFNKLYNEAMQFRDWQTCENLLDFKEVMRSSFIAGASTKEKKSEQILEHCNKIADADGKAYSDLNNKLNKAIETLEYYANGSSYDSCEASMVYYYLWEEQDTIGKRAQETLDEIRGKHE